MRSLQDFAVSESTNIFVDADKLPAFFENNLVEASRVVKVFRDDPQANIRVFYYQYLKLCFEVNECDYEQYIRKIQDIINDPNFAFVFDESQDPSVFNDLQFKQLIMEFFGLLGEGEANIQACLNTYPLIDTVFIYFFRSILILTNVTDNLYGYIDRMNLFNILVSHFNVEIDVHDNCVRFPQTDIFVYEDQPEQVFMAFIDSQKQLPPSKENIEDPIYQENIQEQIQLKPAHAKLPSPQMEVQNLIAPKPTSHRSKAQGKQSYIEGDFLDYTSNSPALHTLVKANNLKQSGTHEELAYQKPKQPPKSQFSNQDYNPKPAVEAKTKIDPPQYVNNGNSYQPEYATKTQYNQAKTTINNGISNGFAEKSQKYDPLSAKNSDQFSYTNPVSAYGVKDLGLASQKADIYSQSNNYLPYQPKSNTSEISIPKANSYVTQPSNSFQANNFSQMNNFTPPNQFSNLPNYQASPYNSVKTPSSMVSPQFASYKNVETKKPTFAQIQPSFDSKKPSSYEQSGVKPTSKQSGKNPYGLNVSEEFTNSFTMKLMNEPHRSNVTGIRQRARNFRNSIKTFIS